MLHGLKQIIVSCPGVNRSLWGKGGDFTYGVSLVVTQNNVQNHANKKSLREQPTEAISHHSHHLSCEVCLVSWSCFHRIYMTHPRQRPIVELSDNHYYLDYYY